MTSQTNHRNQFILKSLLFKFFTFFLAASMGVSNFFVRGNFSCNLKTFLFIVCYSHLFWYNQHSLQTFVQSHRLKAATFSNSATVSNSRRNTLTWRDLYMAITKGGVKKTCLLSTFCGWGGGSADVDNNFFLFYYYKMSKCG